MAAANGYTNVTALNDADEFVLWQAGAVVNMTWSAFRGVIDDWFLPLTGGTLTGELTLASTGAISRVTVAVDTGFNSSFRHIENGIVRGAYVFDSATQKAGFALYDSGGANARYTWRAVYGGSLDLFYGTSIVASTDSLGLTVAGVLTDTQDAANIGEAGDVTIADGVSSFVHTGTSTRSAATLRLPLNPKNNQRVDLMFAGAITTLTLTGATGSTYSILGALTTVAANGFAAYRYRSANTTWYRCG